MNDYIYFLLAGVACVVGCFIGIHIANLLTKLNERKTEKDHEQTNT
jgi:hypothetical protein